MPVVPKDSPLKSLADLKGKRVSLDEPGSGTLVDAKIILEAFGLSEADVTAEYLQSVTPVALTFALNSETEEA